MSYTYPPVPPENGWEFITPFHHDTYPAISPLTTTSNTRHAHHAIFITGASKGLGLAMALSYARAGASHIAIAARSPLSPLIPSLLSAAAAAGHPAPQILALELDVLSLESVQAAAVAVRKAFGKLDVLVNNAGCLEQSKGIVESDPETYWGTWEVNYRGVYLMTREFLPLLLEEDGEGKGGLKTVVNVSSVGAHMLRPGASAYQGSKFALLKLTEAICVEHAKDGVVAFSVHPGGVMTELASNMPKELYPLLCDTPELGADSIVFLTQERREWLAGRYISLNWDMPTLLSRKEEIVKGDKLKMRLTV